MRHVADRAEDLIDLLSRLHHGASRNRLRTMLDVGRVAVNDETERRAKRRIEAGDVVTVGARKPPPGAVPRLRILLEDDAIVVVDKPAGLLTVRTDRGETDTLYDRLFEREKAARPGGRIFIVHRLDRPTSGVILFAKDEATKERLQSGFASGGVERVYQALVEGVPQPAEGTIDLRLAESATLQVYVTPSARHGHAAVTHYRVLTQGNGMALVEARLGTGRRHQIRAHMAAIGHPVAGDKEHGATGDPVRRLALHAAALKFPHPATGARVQVASPTPRAFKNALLAASPAQAANERQGGPGPRGAHRGKTRRK